jgi:hypothetical protein
MSLVPAVGAEPTVAPVVGVTSDELIENAESHDDDDECDHRDDLLQVTRNDDRCNNRTDDVQ